VVVPTLNQLQSTVPWTALETDASDWAAAPPDVLRELTAQAMWIRVFEEYVLELAADGLVHGPAHSSIGQEGGAIGSALRLRSTDMINGSHRGHHQFLAKALGHVRSERGAFGQLALGSADREVLRRSLAEICGLADGYCKGRGGSMHLQWHEAGAMGTNAIVGGGAPLAAGYAWNQKRAGTDDVTVTYFGDGAINIGSVLETLNLAAAWKLPLCFFVENNRYAVSTGIESVTAEPRLSARGSGFGIPAWKVDGMDALAVQLAMDEALAWMRAGNGPTIVEADVYRYFHQNGPYPGSAFGYRTKDEELEWRARDPLERLLAETAALGVVEPDEAAALRAEVATVMREIGEELFEPDPAGKPGARRVRPSKWPDPGFVDVGVLGDLSELDGVRYEEPSSFAGETTERRFIDAVSDVMGRRMETDARIVVLGEDVHTMKGGPSGATKAAIEVAPDRVLGTPICENAFTGLAGGMALDGRFRPVVELMYADFMWVAADQLFNQVAKARHMFGGESSVPFVMRSKLAIGTGYGSQHSIDPAGILTTAPGLRVVAPSTPFDYIGLMNTALACEDPVVVLEHVELYPTKGQVPTSDLDYHLPIGKAAVRCEGADLTVISYLSMVQKCLDAVEESGVSADVIDLRWLDRASIDWTTIEASVRKTNRVLIVEQAALGTSYGGWLADELQRRLFDYLDAPIERLTGGLASPSISKVLEAAALVQTADVTAKLVALCAELGTVG
jgi:2-oxoisovalerate dehydrogenase E1 component